MLQTKFTRIAFDMSSVMWTNLRRGVDTEHGYTVEFQGKTVKVNSAVYGFDRVLAFMTEALDLFDLTPMHALLVFEGMSSKSKRALRYSGYKAGAEKAPQEYNEFQKLSDMLWERWKDLGAIKLKTDYCEGDDTLAYLAQNTESDLVICSNDGDLSILAGTNAYGATVTTYSLGQINRNPITPYDVRHLTLYKSLVGDPSDKIKGAHGFGEKAWERIAAKYGVDGLDELEGLIATEQRGPLERVALDTGDADLKLILESWQGVTASYEVAKLHPEWVDTMDAPLQITPGFVRRAQGEPELSFKPWYATGHLATLANFEKLAGWARQEFKKSDWVSLDIETAPDDESAAWALAEGKGAKYVDVLGARTTGIALTFGNNQQHSIYFSIDHAETENIPFAAVWDLVQDIPGECVIQNVNFELPVLYLGSGGRHKDKSEFGFIPNVRDAKIEANYVNENEKTGLKQRSKLHLGYDQVTYEQVTTISGRVGTLPRNGEILRTWTDEEGNQFDECRYNMRQLPAKRVISYGLDDTRCTSALHNYYRLVMELEHTWQTYLDVEIDAAYMTAASYLDGVPFSMARMRELVEKDGKAMRDSWNIVKAYLTEKGWNGTICPTLSEYSTPKEIKEALEICTGYKLTTQVKLPVKLLALMQSITLEKLHEEALKLKEAADKAAPEGEGEDGDGEEAETVEPTLTVDTVEQTYKNIQLFAAYFAKLLAGDADHINTFIGENFTGEPILNFGSPKQKQRLLYEVMALPVRVRNKPTKAMRARGDEGSPKTDALAIAYAMRDATEEQKAVLEAIKLHLRCKTKFSLFYNKYPHMLHWSDGKLHPSVNQSQTNTRRASCADPNFQQMPKHPKIEGEKVEFRECIVPHKRNAVVCSLDFKAQELVLIADYSQDPNMVSCFVGDNPKDMHIMTGLGILKLTKNLDWSYEEFTTYLHTKGHPNYPTAKQARTDGKKVNFTTEYGAMAEKLAQTMLVDMETAQLYIDAKEEQFPGVRIWKDAVIAEAKEKGFVLTRMGARRHLREALQSDDYFTRSKAERQAVNFKIQSSSAEQTKKAAGRAWRRGLIFKYDCSFYGPIHDETVWSCVTDQLHDFLPEVHACMVAPYGGIKLPITSEISFGPNFGEQIEIGPVATKEAIDAGLQQYYELMAEKRGELRQAA